MSALQTLKLSQNWITDITPLTGSKSLIYVDLSYNYGKNADNTERGIKDLSPLFENQHLKTLIANHNLITSIEGIEALIELTYLDLTDNYISSIGQLSGAGKLETLLIRNNKITMLEPLRGNATLKTLDVSMNKIIDFDVIKTMTALQRLGWKENPVQDIISIDEFKTSPGIEINNG